MNFKEIIESLKIGKKVRRTTWEQGCYIRVVDNHIVNNWEEKVKFNCINTLLSDDWEIFLDKDKNEPLDKKIYSWNVYVEHYLDIKDVKKKIKELKEEWRKKSRRMEIMSGEVAIYELERIIENIFGKGLTE